MQQHWLLLLLLMMLPSIDRRSCRKCHFYSFIKKSSEITFSKIPPPFVLVVSFDAIFERARTNPTGVM